MPKGCQVECEFFRCARKALFKPRFNPYAKPTSRVVITCKETGGECLGSKCQYAMCLKNSLLPGGLCGLEYKVERRFVRSLEQEVKKYEEKYSTMLQRFKGKKLTEDML